MRTRLSGRRRWSHAHFYERFWHSKDNSASTAQHSTGDNVYIRGISVVMLALLAMEVVRCCPFIATDHQGTKQSKSRETQKGYRGMRFWGRVAVDLGY